MGRAAGGAGVPQSRDFCSFVACRQLARRPAAPPGHASMSYMLPHLHNGWQVDQAILSEEDRVVVIRFGHDWDPTCMKMDEVLYSIAEKVTARPGSSPFRVRRRRPGAGPSGPSNGDPCSGGVAPGIVKMAFCFCQKRP